MRGVNRGMQMRRSVPFFAKSVDPPIFLLKSETTITSGKLNVNDIVSSDFVQKLKRATCLITITQYNSTNLDELINIPTEADRNFV